MNKKLRLIRNIAIGFFGLFFILIIVAGITVKMVVTKDFVATKIEENINGRVEIKDISVPLWAALSGITVDGFKIAGKDKEMEKPMEERTPIQNAVISFESFNFRLALGALITSMGKDLNLTSLVITKPTAHIVLFAEGGNNLTSLLIKPKTAEQIAKEKEEAAKEAAEKKEEPVEQKGPAEPFSIKSIPTVIKMGKLGIEDGYFTIEVKKLGNTLTASGVRFLLKDVLIDPNDLANKNQVNVSTGLDLALKENSGSAVKSFRILFDANGRITPFDAKTGRVSENIVMNLGLLKGTTVTGLAVMNKLKNYTSELNKIGVKLDFLGDTQTLSQDSKATIAYSFGKVTLIEPPALVTPDFSFRLTKDDFMNIKSMAHLLRGDFQLSEKHTNGIKAQVSKTVDQGVGPLLSSLPEAIRSQAKAAVSAEKVTNSLLAPAMSDGKITLGVESSGNLTSPDVKVTKPVFPDVGTMISNQISAAGVDVQKILQAELDKKKKELENKAKAEANRLANEGKKQLENEAKKALRGLF
ncbi:MAG: hypothetical protein KDK41_07415 [Leptospiraceae bacterium]|nr:hypothetical protein [Leptospiraceae bacterium]